MLGLALGIGTGLATGRVLARAYLSTVSSQLHLIALCALGCCAVTAVVLPLAIPAVRARVRRMSLTRCLSSGLRGT